MSGVGGWQARVLYFADWIGGRTQVSLRVLLLRGETDHVKGAQDCFHIDALQFTCTAGATQCTFGFSALCNRLLLYSAGLVHFQKAHQTRR